MIKNHNNKLLLVAIYDPNGLNTIKDNINSLKNLSKFQIDILNLYPNTNPNLMIPSYIDLRNYYGIIIHPTICYFPQNLASIDHKLELKLRNYPGVKILMKQDEHVHTYQTARLIKEKGFDLVLTCVSPEERFKVYPKDLTGDIKFFQTLTGYISPFLRNLHSSNLEMDSRKNIGYRGSIQPLFCGKLGFEKRKIGFDVSKKCQELNIPFDISSRWEDRIHGNAWFTYLRNLKAVLGVESGSNIFDFEGEVAKQCEEFLQNNSSLTPESEEVYFKAHESFLHKYEENVHYNQISPRHFEAAASMTPQILYEGEYSGIFIPWKHYLPLKKDMSNFSEIIDKIHDSKFCTEITQRAYEEIILKKDYQFETFAENFDQQVEEIADQKNTSSNKASKKNKKRKGIILVPHELHIDPRVNWFTSSFNRNYELCVIGIHQKQDPGTLKISTSDLTTKITVSPDLSDEIFLNPIEIANINRDALFWTQGLNKFSLDELSKNPILCTQFLQDENTRFSWLCKHFLQVSASLFFVANKIENVDFVVSCDLNSLIAGVLIAQKFKIPLIYDAHEYWPFADPSFYYWEENFFQEMEKDLLRFVDFPITVTNQLAKIMSDIYGKAFFTLPNAESRKIVSNITPRFKKVHSNEICRFLFQGNYAPSRGIDQLIKIWPQMTDKAYLYLRGPENQYMDEYLKLAKKNGLLNKRIFFLPKVKEEELVSAASEFDVGIIPYDPSSSINYKFCCPNKLSQYMAAGIPILANDLDFVKEHIEKANCGIALDFNDEIKLIKIVEKLTKDASYREKLGENGQNYFNTEFNWEQLSTPIFEKIDNLISQNNLKQDCLNFSQLIQLENDIEKKQMILNSLNAQESVKIVSQKIEPNHSQNNLKNFQEVDLNEPTNFQTRTNDPQEIIFNIFSNKNKAQQRKRILSFAKRILFDKSLFFLPIQKKIWLKEKIKKMIRS